MITLKGNFDSLQCEKYPARIWDTTLSHDEYYKNQWTTYNDIIAKQRCIPREGTQCFNCIFDEDLGKAVIIWVDPDQYPTGNDFHKASLINKGITLHIDDLPDGVKEGTYVFVAHRNAVAPNYENFHYYTPAIVAGFRITEIEKKLETLLTP